MSQSFSVMRAVVPECIVRKPDPKTSQIDGEESSRRFDSNNCVIKEEVQNKHRKNQNIKAENKSKKRLYNQFENKEVVQNNCQDLHRAAGPRRPIKLIALSEGAGVPSNVLEMIDKYPVCKGFVQIFSALENESDRGLEEVSRGVV